MSEQQWNLYLAKSEMYSCFWFGEVVSSGISWSRCEHVNAHLNDAPPGHSLSYVLHTLATPICLECCWIESALPDKGFFFVRLFTVNLM